MSKSQAQAFGTDVGIAEVTSRVPLHTFTGRSEYLVGIINLADSTIDFFLDLTTIRTGIGKRDKDLRITLNTDEFPFAEFYGKLVSPFDLNREDPQTVAVEGTFTVNGISRPFLAQGTLESIDDALRLEASWELNLLDYKIKPPRLLIVKVNEVQKIRIEAVLQYKSE